MEYHIVIENLKLKIIFQEFSNNARIENNQISEISYWYRG